MKISSTSPQVFWNQYKSFREAAEALSSGKNGAIDIGVYMKRLNPIYFLIGHATECLFKSCLPPDTWGHDLIELYGSYSKSTGITLAEEELQVLTSIRDHFFPGTAANSVRYPEPGSKSFNMPYISFDLMDTLAKSAEGRVRDNQISYIKMRGEAAQISSTGIHG